MPLLFTHALLPTRTSRSISAEVDPSLCQMSSSLCWYAGLFHPRFKSPWWLLLNFMCSCVKSLWETVSKALLQHRTATALPFPTTSTASAQEEKVWSGIVYLICSASSKPMLAAPPNNLAFHVFKMCLQPFQGPTLGTIKNPIILSFNCDVHIIQTFHLGLPNLGIADETQLSLQSTEGFFLLQK